MKARESSNSSVTRLMSTPMVRSTASARVSGESGCSKSSAWIKGSNRLWNRS